MYWLKELRMNDRSRIITIVALSALAAGVLVYLNNKGVFKGCCSKSRTVAASQANKDEALLTLNGKVAITTDDFDGYVEKIVAVNPQMANFLKAMPDVKDRILDGLIAERVMSAWAETEHIRDTPDFKKMYALALEDVERQLVARAFQEHLLLKITVADADIAAYFEKNKDSNPRFIQERGGLHVHGVAFKAKKQATDWLAKVGKADNFKTVAHKDGLKSEDFGVVNDTNFKVDKNLKKTISAAKKVPSLLTAKAEDGKEWVLWIEKKEAVKYRALAEVSDEIQSALTNERIQEVFGQEISRLKVAYGAQENRSLFRKNLQVAQAEDEVTDETREAKAASTRMV